MKAVAALTKLSVSSRPRSADAAARSRWLQTPVSVIALVEVPLPVSSAFNDSARNTRVAVGSPATTSGSIFCRCVGRVSGAVRAALMFTRFGVR